MRSLVSVVAGFLGLMTATAGLWFLFGYGLDEIPPQRFLIFSLACEVVFAAASGYLTAWIAGSKQGAHSLALAVVIVLHGVVSLPAAPANYPLWVPLSTIFVLAPCSLLGGVLRERREDRRGTRDVVEASI